MKFEIHSTSYYERDEILEEYPCLKEFTIEIVNDQDEQTIYITLSSLEELIKLIKSVRQGVIVAGFPYDDPNVFSIEIYDGYRE